MQSLSPGVPASSYSAFAIANGHGTPFALLPQAQQVTWVTSFGTAPDAINIIIETSLDNTIWSTVATTTAVAGATGTFATSAVNIRASIVSHTNGDTVTVTLVSKAGAIGIAVGGSNTQVQFNDSGALAGDADLTWNKTTNVLTFPKLASPADFRSDIGGRWVSYVAEDKYYYFATVNDANAFYMDATSSSIGNLGVASHLQVTAPAPVGGFTDGLTVFSEQAADQTNFNQYTAYYDSKGKDSTIFDNFLGNINLTGDTVAEHVVGFYVESHVEDTADANRVMGFYYNPEAIAVGANVDFAVGYYSADMAGTGTQPYYFWGDSRGVYRIREDNVADGSGNPQAVSALYNPRFAKYTPGAVDFERVVQQWKANVAQYGTETGGTGTLRKMQLIGGGLILSTDILPTADPHVAGQVWKNSGVLTVSAG